MNHDEIFNTALREVKDEKFEALKEEICTMEIAIEKFLNNVLECTCGVLERDYTKTK